MGKVTFEEPSGPVQPAKGVYRWSYLVRGKTKVAFYIGESGKRKHGPAVRPSTLARGASELQRSTGLSAHRDRRELTTRFIVGTAIKYLTEMEYDVVWEHISGNPREEKSLCRTCRPILQDGNAHILPAFRLRRRDHTPWNNSDPRHVRQAEKRLYRLFDGVFRV